MKDTSLVNSTSDAMRMVKQGAVKIDGVKVDNSKHQFEQPSQVVMQVGKRKFARITFR
jgi:tyrosyl-tRNA synthetase